MKKLIKAVFTLSFFSVIDRLLGFIFKIYLSRELGAAAMGVYQVALSVFFVLLTFTSSGIPLVVSKLTAKHRLTNNRTSENSVTTAALVIGVIVSSVLSLAIIILNKPLSKVFASETSMILILILLPALIFSSIYSALRGNLWGRQKYVTVSLLEILEQVARILLCFIFFAMGFNKINVTVISLSVACGISAFTCVVVYFVGKGRLRSPKGYIVPLVKSSASITFSRAASSIVNSIIAIAVPFLLISSGMTGENAMYIYGYSVGMALPLLYIPLTIVGSLAFAMIPLLSESIESGNKKTVKNQIEKAISFSIIIACVFLPFFTILGKEIGLYVYDNADSGKFLAISAWLLIPLAIESITSSMMNSLDLEMKSFFNYCIGAVVMFLILFAFYNHFSIEILSISMGASWSVASFLDILIIRKKTKISFKFIITLIECIAICIPACFIAKWSYNLTDGLPIFFRLAIPGAISAIFVILLTFVFDMVDIDAFKSKNKPSPQKSESKSKIPKSPLPQNT